MANNSLAKYYKKNKERLQKKTLERYKNVSEQEEGKKQQYGKNNVNTFLKQILVEYRKNYYKV